MEWKQNLSFGRKRKYHGCTYSISLIQSPVVSLSNFQSKNHCYCFYRIGSKYQQCKLHSWQNFRFLPFSLLRKLSIKTYVPLLTGVQLSGYVFYSKTLELSWFVLNLFSLNTLILLPGLWNALCIFFINLYFCFLKYSRMKADLCYLKPYLQESKRFALVDLWVSVFILHKIN